MSAFAYPRTGTVSLWAEWPWEQRWGIQNGPYNTLSYQGCFNDCCLWMSNLSVTDNNDEFSTWHCSWRKSPNHLVLSKLDQAPFIMEGTEKSYHRNLQIFWVWAHLSYLQSFMCLLGTYRILHWQKQHPKELNIQPGDTIHCERSVEVSPWTWDLLVISCITLSRSSQPHRVYWKYF